MDESLVAKNFKIAVKNKKNLATLMDLLSNNEEDKKSNSIEDDERKSPLTLLQLADSKVWSSDKLAENGQEHGQEQTEATATTAAPE